MDRFGWNFAGLLIKGVVNSSPNLSLIYQVIALIAEKKFVWRNIREQTIQTSITEPSSGDIPLRAGSKPQSISLFMNRFFPQNRMKKWFEDNFLFKTLMFVTVAVNDTLSVSPFTLVRKSETNRFLIPRTGMDPALPFFSLPLAPETSSHATYCQSFWHLFYSNILGYLGGFSWAVLVAKTCMEYPEERSPARMILRFFDLFSR